MPTPVRQDTGWKRGSIRQCRKRTSPMYASRAREGRAGGSYSAPATSPFAYSTAGGDTPASRFGGRRLSVSLASAHPAHAETSEIVAQAIARAVTESGLPKAVFSHVHGAGFETGKTLVTHTHTRAVGFTGSYAGGKALFDWANQRPVPIPVFAEMGSINPVFLLPDKLKTSARAGGPAGGAPLPWVPDSSVRTRV